LSSCRTVLSWFQWYNHWNQLIYFLSSLFLVLFRELFLLTFLHCVLSARYWTFTKGKSSAVKAFHGLFFAISLHKSGFPNMTKIWLMAIGSTRTSNTQDRVWAHFQTQVPQKYCILHHIFIALLCVWKCGLTFYVQNFLL